MSNEGALANLDVDAALAALADGALLRQVAAQYGVVKSALHKRLSKHPEYKNTIAIQAHTFVEDAMAGVMDCDADTVNIARARVDAAFKYARAHNPDYADKQQITQISLTVLAGEALAVDASSLLRSLRGVTIEHDAEQQAHPLPLIDPETS